jgi:protein-disulfide isomerase
MKDHIGKIFAVVAVVAVAASVAYSSHVSSQANEGVVIQEHIKGNENASVTLTKYSDFQCPACAQFVPYVEDVLADYGDQIRFEYKHFPLISIHPLAVPAARAAEAAGQQGQFFAMHDALFENQQAWSNSGNPVALFNQYAEEIGLDMELFKRHYKASLLEDKVNSEFREARELGFTGTPSFLLNGEPMQIQSFADFRTQIEAALGVGQGGDEATATGTTEGTTSAADIDVEFGI